MHFEEFKVSVIIPIYNAERFLRKAVESAEILEEVAEIILVEDQSPDNALEVALTLQEEYDKVKVFQHPDKKNHGAGASRNLGIQKTSFDYIAFLDADDYYLPNRFIKDKSIFLSKLQVDGVYNAIGIHYYSEDAKKQFLDAGYAYQEFLTINEAVPHDELFSVLFYAHKTAKGEFSTIGITVKKDIFKKIGYFHTDLKLQQDVHMWKRMAAFCHLEAGELRSPVAIRGVHGENRMTRPDEQKKYKDLWWQSLKNEFKKNKLEPKKNDIFEQAYYNYYTGSSDKLKAIKSLITNILKKPKIMVESNGHFDFNFWKVFGRNWGTLHLISVKNKFLVFLKRVYRVLTRTKNRIILEINNGFDEIKVPIKAIYLRQKFFQSFGQPTILVYTMGKVGSTSLYNGLKTNKLFLPLVYHIHFLTRINLEKINAKYTRAGLSDKKTILMKDLLKGNFKHEEASDALFRIKPNNKWILISVVRDPIDAFFSHIFQNPKVHRPQILSKNGKIDPEKLQNYINDYIGKYTPKNDFISNWFSSEFNEYTNINIYKYPFEYEKGYLLIKTDTLNIIVFELNTLENEVNNVLTELLGKKIVIKLGRANDRKTASNGNLYSQIKKDIIFEKSFLTKIYSTQFANHFYNDETRKKKIEYWCNPRRNT